MKLAKSIKLEAIENRYQFYSVLKNYYQGLLCQNEDLWKQAMHIFYNQNILQKNDNYHTGLKLPQEYDPDAIYEFNALFVGPNKLLAPPYESAYLNAEGLLMQQETLAVREFYENNGLVVNSKNCEPDDHIALELEFICFLLYNVSLNLEEQNYEKADTYLTTYSEFFKEHLNKWVPAHCFDIIAKSKNRFCTGLAHITAEYLNTEAELLANLQIGEGI